MGIKSLGHAVINVRNLDRAAAFYHDILGLPVATRADDFGMIFFTLGNHHDFAVRAVGDDAPGPNPKGVGLYHIAFNVGDTLDELRAMKEHLEANGVKIDRTSDHNVSCSLYLRDPDGNGVELYVDSSDIWKTDPSKVASNQPLAI